MKLTPRYGYLLLIDNLLLRVQLRPEGWSYHVSPIRNRQRTIKDWTVCSRRAGSEEVEICKLEAIKLALTELGRKEDPRRFLEDARWIPPSKSSDELRNEEEYRLLKDYQAAARQLLWAVDRLVSKQGTPRAFNRAVKVADKAQLVMETAREALAEFRKSATHN